MKRPRNRRAPTLDPLGPPEVRQAATSGRTAVMRDNRRDIDDTRPNAARYARRVDGYRTYCPLRRMQERDKATTQITEQHVVAADHFREMVDHATIGAGGERDMGAVHAGFGPSAGPSAAAVGNALASLEVARTMERFAPSQRLLLVQVVLLNHSLQAWCDMQRTEGKSVIAHREMGRLLSVLDLLAHIFADDVAKEMAGGRVPAVA